MHPLALEYFSATDDTEINQAKTLFQLLADLSNNYKLKLRTFIRSSTLRRSFPSNNRSSSSDKCSKLVGTTGGGANANGGMGGGGIGFIGTDANGLNWNGFAGN